MTHLSNTGASSSTSTATAAGSSQVNVPEVSASTTQTGERSEQTRINFSDMVDVDMTKADHSACLSMMI